MSEKLFGTLIPNTRTVPVKDTEGVRKLMIKEASEASTIEYHKEMAAARVWSDEGKFIRINDTHHVETMMVGKNVYDVKTNGEVCKDPVGTDVVLGWPGQLVSDLYQEIKDLSPHLDNDNLTSTDITVRIEKMTKIRDELLQKEQAKEKTKKDFMTATGGTST